MSKFCIKCGNTLSDEDIYCTRCYAIQERVDPEIEKLVRHRMINGSQQSNHLVSQPKKEHKQSQRKKNIIVFLCIFLIIAILVASVLFFKAFMNFLLEEDNPASAGSDVAKGLVAIDELETKLNEAYEEVWNLDDYQGVTDFTVTKVNEDTHDQIFSCFAMPLEGNDVLGHQVMGLAKDGHVIQIQSLFIFYADGFFQAEEDMQERMRRSVLFPVCIFKEKINTLQECGDFLALMDVDEREIVTQGSFTEGDVEYTFMSGVGKGDLLLYLLTIRYLPAFSTGYFEDGSDELSDLSPISYQETVSSYIDGGKFESDLSKKTINAPEFPVYSLARKPCFFKTVFCRSVKFKTHPVGCVFLFVKKTTVRQIKNSCGFIGIWYTEYKKGAVL